MVTPSKSSAHPFRPAAGVPVIAPRAVASSNQPGAQQDSATERASAEQFTPPGAREQAPMHAPESAVPATRSEEAVWRVLEQVPDPEIPVLSITDLGIVRYVRWPEGESSGKAGPHVGLTPTYSGCPATEVIRRLVRDALNRTGYTHAVIEDVLSPPWTSDWISEEGRRKLEAFGIAPPAESVSSPRRLFAPLIIACPRCGSRDTERLSEFGSTPCKAHYRCKACLEPFDYFKCI